MLKQEINLYKSFESPQPTPTFLTWKRYLQISTLIFSWFTILLLYSLWSVHSLKTQKENLTISINQAQKKFIAIKSGYPELFFSQDVKTLVQQLQEDVNAKEKILTEIIHRTFFSQIFLGLSQAITRNVWLTDIIVIRNGKEITLKGHSIGTSNLQTFIASLTQSEIFKPYTLNVNNIEKPPQANDQTNVNFEFNLAEKSK